MVVATILIIFSSVIVIIGGNTVSNVRLVGHDVYITSVIEETMREVERLEWCNLKVTEVNFELEEDMLGSNVMGQLVYTNGFVVSIRWVDIISHSVQQVWRFDRVANTTTVEVRGALRLHSVTLGFDVLANLTNGPERYTATFVHPLLQYDFTVIKDMFSDEINVTVVGTVPRTTNVPRFIPNTHHSQAFASLYDWNSTTVEIREWGSAVFQPIAYKLVHNEIKFPRICYNCQA